ncbi:MAG TPA: hypothetical protein VNK95_05495 [Caldilineaceae bacterium]|nr:hypothetical protein [Caldilineaceae bacterium]
MAESEQTQKPEATEGTHMADLSPYTTPRWVKIFAIMAIVLVLLVLFLLFTGIGGDHGPRRHLPAGDAGGTPPVEDRVRQP